MAEFVYDRKIAQLRCSALSMLRGACIVSRGVACFAQNAVSGRIMALSGVKRHLITGSNIQVPRYTLPKSTSCLN